VRPDDPDPLKCTVYDVSTDRTWIDAIVGALLDSDPRPDEPFPFFQGCLAFVFDDNTAVTIGFNMDSRNRCFYGRGWSSSELWEVLLSPHELELERARREAARRGEPPPQGGPPWTMHNWDQATTRPTTHPASPTLH